MSASTPPVDVRATIDTNLFVSGLIWLGVPGRLQRAWSDGAFRLVTSEELRAEVGRVIMRAKFARYDLTPERITNTLSALARAEQADPLAVLPVAVRDPDDEKVLACALGGSADFLVSGDADLLSLDGDPALGPLRIVTARQFLAYLGIDPDETPAH